MTQADGTATDLRPRGGPLYTLVLLLLGHVHAQAPTPDGQGQALEGRSLVDHDAGFSLALPSTDWRFLPEADARAVLPDAIAGAMAKNGHFGVILVEGSLADLEAMNELARSALGAAFVSEISREETTFQGQTAIRSLYEVEVNGIPLRQERVVFEWDRHLFQVVCNGPLAPVNNRCGEFIGGFALNHTMFRARERPPTPDVQTRQWRIKEGQFESAVSGMTLRPPPGWRLMVGGELKTANAVAEVGLTRERPDAFTVLISEASRPDAHAQMAATHRANFVAGLDATPDGEIAARVGGTEVPLLEFDGTAAVPIHYWHGTFGQGNRSWQVLSWTTGNDTGALRPEIQAMLSSFAVMDEPRRAALERELATVPVPIEVGENWSVRNQVYTNYDHGIAWAAPPGLWDIKGGAAAEEAWTGSLAILEQPRSGTTAVLVPLTGPGPLARIHANVVDAIGAGDGATTRTRVAGAAALTTEFESNTEDLRVHWRISSFRAGNGERMALVTYALAPAWDGARADAIAAASTLASAKGVPAHRVSKRMFESHRLGVGMALHEGLACSYPTSLEKVRSQADGISCLGGGRSVLLMAVRDGSNGLGGEDAVLSTVYAMLGDGLGSLSGLSQVKGRGSLDGVETLRLSFGPHGDVLEVDIFSKDKRVVMFMAAGMPEAERRRWRSGVYLLDGPGTP